MDLLVDVGDKQEAITELSFKIKGKKIIGLTQALENELDLFFFFLLQFGVVVHVTSHLTRLKHMLVQRKAIYIRQTLSTGRGVPSTWYWGQPPLPPPHGHPFHPSYCLTTPGLHQSGPSLGVSLAPVWKWREDRALSPSLPGLTSASLQISIKWVSQGIRRTTSTKISTELGGPWRKNLHQSPPIFQSSDNNASFQGNTLPRMFFFERFSFILSVPVFVAVS